MELGFLVKKLIGTLAMPWPAFLLFLLLCLTLPWTRRRIGSIALIGILSFAVLTMSPISHKLFAGYERQFSPPNLEAIQSQEVRWIVVLGAGTAEPQKELPALSHLSSASLARLTEGLRWATLLPEAKLLLSGSGVFTQGISNAEMYYRAAQELGVGEQRLVRIESPVDTVGEAVAIKDYVRREPFLLVTSASHMPRAERIMLAEKLTPIAAPTDYIYHPQSNHWLSFIPNEGNFRSMRRIWHEYIGQLWLTVKGIPKADSQSEQ